MSTMDLSSLMPLLAAVSLAVLLFYGQRPQDLRVVWVFKPLTSALFVLAALWRGPGTRYDWLVVAGLVLSMAGDVSLIRRERNWFLAGLVAFLLGHVAYIMAFGTRPAESLQRVSGAITIRSGKVKAPACSAWAGVVMRR